MREWLSQIIFKPPVTYTYKEAYVNFRKWVLVNKINGKEDPYVETLKSCASPMAEASHLFKGLEKGDIEKIGSRVFSEACIKFAGENKEAFIKFINLYYGYRRVNVLKNQQERALILEAHSSLALDLGHGTSERERVVKREAQEARTGSESKRPRPGSHSGDE